MLSGKYSFKISNTLRVQVINAFTDRINLGIPTSSLPGSTFSLISLLGVLLILLITHGSMRWTETRLRRDASPDLGSEGEN